MKLKAELEQERARVATLGAVVGNENPENGDTSAQSANLNGCECSKDKFPPHYPEQGSSIVKSASSSDLFTSSTHPSPTPRLPTSSHHTSERLSITDMVTEVLQNPSSMASIRSNLKADNLTPRIQRKFRYKMPSAALSAVGSVPSPLAQDGARAPETGPLGAPPTRASLKDK